MKCIKKLFFRILRLLPECLNLKILGYAYFLILKILEVKTKKNKKKQKKILILRTQNSIERWVFYRDALSFYKSLKNNYSVQIKVFYKRNNSNIIKEIEQINPKLVLIDSEDGKIQLLMEKKGLYFFGSGSETSKLCYDKIKTITFVKKNKIKVPKTKIYKKNLEKEFCFPFIFKPNSLGSSIRIKKVNSIKELKNKKNWLDKNTLIQEFIKGTEYTIYLTKNKNFLFKIYEQPINYKQKYFEKTKNKLISSNFSLSEKVLMNKSRFLFKRLNCQDLVRIDWIIKNNKHYFLEINTIPGLDPKGKIKSITKYLGISYREFLKELIINSINRQKK